jgi:hypothetical protein
MMELKFFDWRRIKHERPLCCVTHPSTFKKLPKMLHFATKDLILQWLPFVDQNMSMVKMYAVHEAHP